MQERCGSVVTLVRVSAFHSETFRGEAPDGDPPPWLVEVCLGLPRAHAARSRLLQQTAGASVILHDGIGIRACMTEADGPSH